MRYDASTIGTIEITGEQLSIEAAQERVMNDQDEKSGTPLPRVPRENPTAPAVHRVGKDAGKNAKDVPDYQASPLMRALSADWLGFGAQNTPKTPLIRRVASRLRRFNREENLEVTKDTITVKVESGAFLGSVRMSLGAEEISTGAPKDKSHSSCGDRFYESWWEPLLMDGTPVGQLEISCGDKGYTCIIKLDRSPE